MSDDFPLVSCLMPTYNRREFIPRALRMFQRQNWPNKQLVILDDGTDQIFDAVFKACVAYPARDVKYEYFPGTRLTLGAKLNIGAGKADGSILINWDDDDWNAPDRIATQVRHMQITGKPFVGFSGLIYFAERNDYGWEYTGNAFYASGSTHCYTREYALAHPRPDMTVGEDNIAVAEARRLGALSTISGVKCLVACDHPNNCSFRGYAGDDPKEQEFFELLRSAADEFRKIPLSEFSATIHSGDL